MFFFKLPTVSKRGGIKRKMSKKALIILITITLIITVTIIGVIIKSQQKNNKSVENEQAKNTKTTQLYNKISEAKAMTFTKILDDNNKIFIAIKENKGYKEITTNGNIQKYIVKEGDTYYLDETSEKYYKYQSNDTILTEIKEQFDNLINKNFSEGKEKLEGKNYNYEEFAGYQDFLFNYELTVNDLELAKTKLYYDGGNLNYIKTIVGEKEELLKIDIAFKSVKEEYFKIPDNYTNGEE